jgi:hypothetical protein
MLQSQHVSGKSESNPSDIHTKRRGCMQRDGETPPIATGISSNDGIGNEKFYANENLLITLVEAQGSEARSAGGKVRTGFLVVIGPG